MSAYPVRLYRNSSLTSWGFRLQGGADFHTPIIVQRVFAGSPAEGQLQRGDILTGIENYDATSMLHSEAQELVRRSGNTISLNVKRPQGARVLRGQSLGPMSRQPGTSFGSSYQQNQFNHPPQQAYQQHQHQQQQQQHQRQQNRRQDQYNVYVGGGQSQRHRSESASQNDDWRHRTHEQQWQQPQQKRKVVSTAVYDAYRLEDSMHHHHDQPRHHQHQQHHQQRANPAQSHPYELPSQKSIDDEDVDYSFSKQSVAERMRRFMQQANSSYQPSNTYHSVPRSGYPSAANPYRQRQPFVTGSSAHRSPLGDFGWSPSPDKFHQAANRLTASRAAFEQSSYLPSQGIGRADSPVRSRPGGRSGVGGINQRHSVSGAFNGPRYSSMLQLGNGGASGGGSSSQGTEPFTYNNRQYNTPINMYSRQNVANVFEGQTGIRLREQPGRTANASQEPAFTQSQVYKLVHEQDRQQQSLKKQIRVQTQHPHSWTPATRQDSEFDEPGVSEF